MCITFFCIDPYSHKTIEKQNDNNENHEDNLQINQHDQRQVQNTIENNNTSNNKQNNIIKVKIPKTTQNTPHHPTLTHPLHPKPNPIKFIIAFNRDEQASRKTKKLNHFNQDPNIIAGRDSISTGTWLGINIKTRLMVVLTNYQHSLFRAGKSSRGQLVYSFLRTDFIHEEILNNSRKIDERINEQMKLVLMQTKSHLYPAFNLLVYNICNDSIFYICSELALSQPILLAKNKVYGLCNSDLFTIWPKTQHGIDIFTDILNKTDGQDDEQILEIVATKLMKDTTMFSKNRDQESSIFLEPFFSTLQNAVRMTKTTFIALIKQHRDSDTDRQSSPKRQIIMRQITHINNNYKKYLNQQLQTIKEQHAQDDYDHKTQTTINYKFSL